MTRKQFEAEWRRLESAYLQGALPHHQFVLLMKDLQDREHETFCAMF